MEHEVVVPMPATLVRQALRDPALLARCVPGLSTEPAAVGSGQTEEISGRLRLRIGGSTITYRGVLSLIEGREGVLTAFAEGQEARGDGEATATVRISVAEAGEGASVRFTGDLSATGRLAEFDAETLAAAGRRLLDRFATALTSQGADGVAADSEEDADENEADGPTATVLFLEDHTPADAVDDDSLDDDLSDLIAFSDDDAERFGLPTGAEADAQAELPADRPAELPLDYPQEPVLSGPVRRSIVGRSAEEVDHAPPRGPYAPALPARSARARAASRWGGEGGAATPLGTGIGARAAVPWVIGGGVALLGGAVVLVRVLRRR
ncbi:SRPBCC family protein [Kitasatospora sp. NPDC050543]|uniref:SRPBCC family protein n=1 Tax=Kitasatospora sp. NPDC050543 TaxID=3364054 RepID=UPI0037A1F08B